MKKLNWKLILISLWLLLTLSLAGWWMTLGLSQIEKLAHYNPQAHAEFTRQKHMLVSEGISWIILLVASGVTLLFLVIKQEREGGRLKEFFAAFSHDMKTALASLRLQAESLKEDFDHPSMTVLDRLVADTVRLQLKLENSLMVASPERSGVILESLELSKLVQSLSYQWPQTQIQLAKNCVVEADERALKNLLSNIIQNAIIHGKASAIKILPKQKQNQKIALEISDNGNGFNGDFKKLTEPFFRHTTSSGSGLGLHIAKSLAKKMNGLLNFELREKSLVFELELSGVTL